MLLEVSHVSKSYPGLPVLHDVSLTADAGEIVCLLGPSGCGKTTLLRIVAGLENPDAGRVIFAGQDLAGVPAHRRNFGLMFQDYALFPHRDVAANVAFGLRMQGRAAGELAGRVGEMLALVALAGYETRRVTDLSGGEQQRVALARSLAPGPQLLMLDEPLGALDRALREQLMNELRLILKRVGVTVLYVTHDQEEAFAVADRIVVMNRGAIEQVGSAMAVYRDPATLFVADFVGRINALPATLDGGGSAAGVRIGEQVFRCEHASLAGHAPGCECQVYLRPEDVLARPASADGGNGFAAGDPNVFEAEIDAIDFMGPYCLVRVTSPRLGSVRLSVYLSLNYLAESRLEVGSRLPLRLMPQRMRVFG